MLCNFFKEKNHNCEKPQSMSTTGKILKFSTTTTKKNHKTKHQFQSIFLICFARQPMVFSYVYACSYKSCMHCTCLCVKLAVFHALLFHLTHNQTKIHKQTNRHTHTHKHPVFTVYIFLESYVMFCIIFLLRNPFNPMELIERLL